MIVLDTSAVIAVIGREPEAQSMTAALAGDGDRRISAPVLFECVQVASRWGDEAACGRLDGFVSIFNVRIEPFTEPQFRVARDAFLTYGKGRGHPAKLNQMDCIAYALAKSLDAPLLFKGDDFLQTDVKRAI